MAKKKPSKTALPIKSTDGVDLAVGQKVYMVDWCGLKPKLLILKIGEMNLRMSARRVYMTDTKNRERGWSPKVSARSCSVSDDRDGLYAIRSNAQKLIDDHNHETAVEQLKDEIDSTRGGANQAANQCAYHRRELRKETKRLESRLLKLKKLKAKLKAMES